MRSSLRFLAAAVLAAACSDDPAADPELLSRADSEPAGANCAHGGNAVRSGLDDDGDGVLDDGEVDEVAYVCSPLPATVSRIRSEPPGVHCPSGGTAVDIGPDRNGDGDLDGGEVTSTTYACSVGEIWEGDASVSATTDETTLARLREATLVTGDLTVVGGVALPGLRTVVGSVELVGGADLPALGTVGGDLDFDGTQETGVIALPALGSVGRDLRLPRGPELERVALPRLTSVTGGVIAVSWSDATTLEAPALRTIGGTLYTDHAPQIATQLPGLVEVGGDVAFGFDELEAVSLPALTFVQGEIRMVGTTLASVSLPALSRIGGLRVESPLLTELRLPQLSTCDGVFSVKGPALTALDLPALQSAGSAGREDASGIRLVQGALRELTLPALRDAPSGISVVDMPALTKVVLPALVDARHLDVLDPLVTSVEAPKLEAVEYMNLEGPIATLGFDALTAIRGHLDIRETALPDLRGFSRVSTIRQLILLDNPDLVSLDGLTVRSLGDLQARGNPRLASVTGLAAVTAIQFAIQITGSPALTSLEGLHRVVLAGRVEIRGTGITAMEGLRNLDSIEHTLTIGGNDSLTTLAGLDRLAYVGTEIDIAQNPALPAAEVAALKARLGF